LQDQVPWSLRHANKVTENRTLRKESIRCLEIGLIPHRESFSKSDLGSEREENDAAAGLERGSLAPKWVMGSLRKRKAQLLIA